MSRAKKRNIIGMNANFWFPVFTRIFRHASIAYSWATNTDAKNRDCSGPVLPLWEPQCPTSKGGSKTCTFYITTVLSVIMAVLNKIVDEELLCAFH